MIAGLLVVGLMLAGLGGGYYLGGKYGTLGLTAELNVLLQDAKTDVAAVKAWLASKL